MRRWILTRRGLALALLALALIAGCHGGRYYDDDCGDGRRPRYRSSSSSHRHGHHHYAHRHHADWCD